MKKKSKKQKRSFLNRITPAARHEHNKCVSAPAAGSSCLWPHVTVTDFFASEDRGARVHCTLHELSSPVGVVDPESIRNGVEVNARRKGKVQEVSVPSSGISSIELDFFFLVS